MVMGSVMEVVHEQVQVSAPVIQDGQDLPVLMTNMELKHKILQWVYQSLLHF